MKRKEAIPTHYIDCYVREMATCTKIRYSLYRCDEDAEIFDSGSIDQVFAMCFKLGINKDNVIIL